MTILRCVSILILLAAFPAAAAPLCTDDPEAAPYVRALCEYNEGRFKAAEVVFRAIVEKDEHRPETLKSRYFLARALMKQKRWQEASSEWIKIYSISPAFYKEWSCDFLLGECRRALGLD
ncbi:MAG TPA: CDC27 family protein [Thermoanaerobaculia bacterium]|nr:CDC27 family protein [Thermoanaerobaculia bacterium]